MINVNMTDKAGVTLATAGKYCADNVKVTPLADILRKDEQAKTATPTTSTQDITPDVGKALSKVTVNPITAAIVGNLDADSFASSIVAAIEGKGIDVPSGAKLDALAALIEAIQAGGGGGISEIFGCSKFVVGSCTQTGMPNFYAPYPSDIFTDINKISVLAITKSSFVWDGPYFTAIAYIKRNAVTIKGYVTNDSTSFTAYSSMEMELNEDKIVITTDTNYGIAGQPYYYVMWQED